VAKVAKVVKVVKVAEVPRWPTQRNQELDSICFPKVRLDREKHLKVDCSATAEEFKKIILGEVNIGDRS
jgi:hypothetical protein